MLHGESAFRWVDFREATGESGERSHYSESLGGGAGITNVPPRSVWLAWQAPRDGVAQLVLSRREPLVPSLVAPRQLGAPRLVIYTNVTSLASLRKVEGEVFGKVGHELTRFPVVAGRDYRFALSGSEPWMGEYGVSIRLDSSAPPKNDRLVEATILDSSSSGITFDLDRASVEEGEPDFGVTEHIIVNDRGYESSAIAPRGGRSIWFRWTAPTNGGYAFHASAPGAYPQLAVFRRRSTPPTDPPITFNDLERLSRATNGGFAVWLSRSCELCEFEYSVSSYRSADATVTVSAKAGDQFWIQVDRLWGDPDWWTAVDPFDNPANSAWGTVNLVTANRSAGVLHINPTAPNDTFERTLPLPDTDLSSDFFAGASFEEAEPNSNLLGGNHGSLWWSWIVPVTGNYLAEGPTCEAYRGNTLADLERLTSDQLPSMIQGFAAIAGERLYFRCLVAPSDTSSQPRLVPVIYGTPPNDRFDRPEPLNLEPVRQTTEITQAPGPLSFEAGEPAEGGLTNSGSAWFVLIPQKDQMVRLSVNFFQRNQEITSAEQVGATLELFEGNTLSNLRAVAPVSPGFVTQEFALHAGVEYRLRVQAEASRWTYFSQYYVETAPRNDWFSGRIPVPQFSLGDDRSYSLRTAEAGEPAHAGQPAARSLWYEWQAPRSGPQALEFQGRRGSRIALYRGETLNTLVPLVSIRLADDSVPQLGSFTAIAGERLALAFEDSSPEWFNQSVSFYPGLENDSFDHPRVFDRPEQISAWPATTSPEERSLLPDAAYGVLWHRWTAPAEGTYSLEVIRGYGSPTNLPLPGIKVFLGESWSSLESLQVQIPALPLDRELILFEAVRAQTYHFAIFPRSQGRQSYRLGMTGPRMDDIAASTHLKILQDPNLMRISSSSRFMHRLDRSFDLHHWDPVKWFAMPQINVFLPVDDLNFGEPTVFLRVVTPE